MSGDNDLDLFMPNSGACAHYGISNPKHAWPSAGDRVGVYCIFVGKQRVRQVQAGYNFDAATPVLYLRKREADQPWTDWYEYGTPMTIDERAAADLSLALVGDQSGTDLDLLSPPSPACGINGGLNPVHAWAGAMDEVCVYTEYLGMQGQIIWQAGYNHHDDDPVLNVRYRKLTGPWSPWSEAKANVIPPPAVVIPVPVSAKTVNGGTAIEITFSEEVRGVADKAAFSVTTTPAAIQPTGYEGIAGGYVHAEAPNLAIECYAPDSAGRFHYPLALLVSGGRYRVQTNFVSTNSPQLIPIMDLCDVDPPHEVYQMGPDAFVAVRGSQPTYDFVDISFDNPEYDEMVCMIAQPGPLVTRIFPGTLTSAVISANKVTLQVPEALRPAGLPVKITYAPTGTQGKLTATDGQPVANFANLAVTNAT